MKKTESNKRASLTLCYQPEFWLLYVIDCWLLSSEIFGSIDALNYSTTCMFPWLHRSE